MCGFLAERAYRHPAAEMSRYGVGRIWRLMPKFFLLLCHRWHLVGKAEGDCRNQAPICVRLQDAESELAVTAGLLRSTFS